jgi:uncharacterized protein YdeI (YjbR/CyaY-like superfamily)
VDPGDALFFESAADFRSWLEQNHEVADQAWIGYWKKTSGRGGLTYAESVDEALCFGWIDGRAGSIDELRYAVRFTPRRKGSIWSNVNVGRVGELTASGRMRDAGLRAFESRRPDRVGVYSQDMENVEFPADLEARFRTHEQAWQFWLKQPPGYRRQMTWWVISAKRDETQRRRMDALIEEHGNGRRLDQRHLPRVSPR